MTVLKGKINALRVTKPRPIVEHLDEVDMARSEHKTYIGLCLDSSGSMGAAVQETIGGFNKNLSVIRRISEHDVYTWLALFGTPNDIDWPIEKGEVADLFDLTHKNYLPYGGTPLLDCIGGMIRRLEREDTQSKTQGFLVISFSDGQENMSQWWSWHKLHAAVKSKDERWAFVFVGPRASHRQFKDAGYKAENLLDWDSCSVTQLMNLTSFSLGRFLAARNSGKLLPVFFK